MFTDAPFTEGWGRPAASSFLLSSTEELGQEGLSSGLHWDGEGGVGEREGGREGEGSSLATRSPMAFTFTLKQLGT